MSTLSLAAVRLLLQDDAVVALVGSDYEMGPWISDQVPEWTVENTGSVGLVINEADEWDAPNTWNSQHFPRLQVDIWADPTRNSDGSMMLRDADIKIEAVQKCIEVHFHTKNRDVAPGDPGWWGLEGYPRIWGDSDQIQNRTGVEVLGSERLTGTLTSDIRDTDGGRMRRLRYGVNTF